MTSFTQDNTGEFVGLTSIPASVLDAYFTALGKVFSEFSSNDDNAVALAMSETQRKICAAAIAGNPLQGKSEAERATALQIFRRPAQHRPLETQNGLPSTVIEFFCRLFATAFRTAPSKSFDHDRTDNFTVKFVFHIAALEK